MRANKVIELRQYTLHPGARDALISLFDREFVENQEACGMSVIGQFRDLNRPDRFVWLRGFPDMEKRAEALASFYDGPVWAAHRDAANATMIDSDDVLLLKPADGGLELGQLHRPVPGSSETPGGLLAANILPLAEGAADKFTDLFQAEMRPLLEEAGATVLATFVTERAANNFPRLPVREDANAFVWLSAFGDETEHQAHLDKIASFDSWRASWETAAPLTSGAATVLRLQPTARSLLRVVGSTTRL